MSNGIGRVGAFHFYKNGVIVTDNLEFHGLVKDSTNCSRNTKQLVKKIQLYIDFLKNNSNLSASRKRIKKAHSKAKLVSGLYTLGSLVLMVLVFLTTLNVKFAGNYSLSIATFFRPLIGIGKKFDFVAILIMVLYLFMVIFAIINFFKCFSKFGRILRRSYKNITTCNKNMLLMEEAGDAFSRTLVAYVMISFIITMLSYAQVDATGKVMQIPFTLFGLVALGVGLLILVPFIMRMKEGQLIQPTLVILMCMEM